MFLKSLDVYEKLRIELPWTAYRKVLLAYVKLKRRDFISARMNLSMNRDSRHEDRAK